MKNVIFSMTMLTLFSCTRLSAQTTLPSGQPVKTGNEWHMPGDALTYARTFTDRLTHKLGLDSLTAKKVYDAYLRNTKSVGEIAVASVSEDEKKSRLKANKAGFDLTLKGILSPAQFAGYLKMDTGTQAKTPARN